MSSFEYFWVLRNNRIHNACLLNFSLLYISIILSIPYCMSKVYTASRQHMLSSSSKPWFGHLLILVKTYMIIILKSIFRHVCKKCQMICLLFAVIYIVFATYLSLSRTKTVQHERKSAKNIYNIDFVFIFFLICTHVYRKRRYTFLRTIFWIKNVNI